MTDEIVIVGGGLAGAATAAQLARAGRSVTVLERDRFPRDKLCGEFLSTESQGLLQEIGCLEEIRALAPKPIDHARFYASSGRFIELPLPGEGMGLSRRALDAVLFQHAARAGARCMQGAEVIGIEPSKGDRKTVRYKEGDDVRTIEARLVIAAYGRRTRLDKTLNRNFTKTRHPFLAFKRHHRINEKGEALARTLQRRVEIHTFDGGYCGMSFVETGHVNVCMLLQRRFMERLEGSGWADVTKALRANSPSLKTRLIELSAVDPGPLAVAEIPFTLKERQMHGVHGMHGVLFVGDAAGMIAPLTGDGQAMALSSAVLLANLIGRHETLSSSTLRSIGRQWNLRWRLRFENRMRLSRTLQGLLMSPGPSDFLVRTVGATPGLGRLLVRLTRGTS